MRSLFAFALLACSTMWAQAQDSTTPAAPPVAQTQEAAPSPSHAYLQTLAPLIEVRSDMGNWSDVELAAFVAASKVASERCLELRRTAFDGPELLALARLCSLGQEWPSTYSAALRYTRDPSAAERLEGYSLLLQADLNMQRWADVVEHLTALHGALTTSTAVAALVDQTVRSLEVPQTSYALQSSLIFKSDFLKCLASCGTDLAPAKAETMAWKTLILLRETGSMSEAGALRELQAALTVASPVVSKKQVDAVRSNLEAKLAEKRFESIGATLPAILRLLRTGSPRIHTAVAPSHEPAVFLLWSNPHLTTDDRFRKELEAARARLSKRAQIVAVQLACTDPAARPVLCISQDLSADLGSSTEVTILGIGSDGKILWNVPGASSSLRAGGAVDAVASKLP